MNAGVVSVSLAELIELGRTACDLPLWPRSIRTQTAGGNRSTFKGRGMEFDETRPYQPGDDIRLLDWRVTARTGRTHTKLFREERERPVMLWVDYRVAMFFATRGAFKSVIAARAAAAVAWSAHAHGDRVGGFVFSNHGHREIKPMRGRHSILRLLRELAAHPAWNRSAPREENSTGIVEQALTRLQRVVRPGSQLFLVSDFRGLESGGDVLGDLARHSDIALCFIHDPLEARLPPPDRYPITDGAGRRFTLSTGDAAFAEAYARCFEQRRRTLLDLALRYRMRFIGFTTTDDPIAVLRGGLLPRPALKRVAT